MTDSEVKNIEPRDQLDIVYLGEASEKSAYLSQVGIYMDREINIAYLTLNAIVKFVNCKFIGLKTLTFEFERDVDHKVPNTTVYNIFENCTFPDSKEVRICINTNGVIVVPEQIKFDMLEFFNANVLAEVRYGKKIAKSCDGDLVMPMVRTYHCEYASKFNLMFEQYDQKYAGYCDSLFLINANRIIREGQHGEYVVYKEEVFDVYNTTSYLEKSYMQAIVRGELEAHDILKIREYIKKEKCTHTFLGQVKVVPAKKDAFSEAILSQWIEYSKYLDVWEKENPGSNEVDTHNSDNDSDMEALASDIRLANIMEEVEEEIEEDETTQADTVPTENGPIEKVVSCAPKKASVLNFVGSVPENWSALHAGVVPILQYFDEIWLRGISSDIQFSAFVEIKFKCAKFVIEGSCQTCAFTNCTLNIEDLQIKGTYKMDAFTNCTGYIPKLYAGVIEGRLGSQAKGPSPRAGVLIKHLEFTELDKAAFISAYNITMPSSVYGRQIVFAVYIKITTVFEAVLDLRFVEESKSEYPLIVDFQGVKRLVNDSYFGQSVIKEYTILDNTYPQIFTEPDIYIRRQQLSNEFSFLPGVNLQTISYPGSAVEKHLTQIYSEILPECFDFKDTKVTSDQPFQNDLQHGLNTISVLHKDTKKYYALTELTLLENHTTLFLVCSSLTMAAAAAGVLVSYITVATADCLKNYTTVY